MVNLLISAMDYARLGMSVNKALKTYNISRRTLYLKAGKRNKRLVAKSVFSEDEENELCTRIFRFL